MRTKVTLVLIFLNVALFVFIFKFERGWRTEEAERQTRRRVLGPETAAIQSLRISGPALSPIELVRTGEQWALTAPINWPANPHAVNRILSELQFLEHETSFSVADLARNNQSLADYGLETPRLTIEFTTGTDSERMRHVALQVGDETKVGNRLYLLSPERDRVHVVGLSLARSLNLPLEELRTDNVFSIPLFEARSLNLQSTAASRVRIRQEGTRWSFESPIIARASKPQVELTINALAALRVHHFLPDALANTPAPSTTNAELRISLIGNNRQETLILLGETEVPPAPSAQPPSTPAADEAEPTPTRTAFIAALEGKATRFVVEVPTPLLNTLRNAQDTLREPHLLDFAPDALTAITLSAPDRPPLTLQQLRSSAEGQGTWQILRSSTEQGPQLQPVDPQRMRDLIASLRDLAALRFVSDAPSDADLESWGFNRPEREITLTLNPSAAATRPLGAASTTTPSEPQTLHLQIGLTAQPNAHAYARLSNARFVYQIPADLLEQTAPEPLHYRQRLLRALPDTARFRDLTITDLRDGSTAFQADASLSPQPETAQHLIDALRHLEAARLLQDHFSETALDATGTPHSWRWRIDTTVSLPSGRDDEQSQSAQLFLTERLGGDLQLAGSPDLDLVFAINQALLDALWPLTYNTGPTTPPEPPRPLPSTDAAALASETEPTNADTTTGTPSTSANTAASDSPSTPATTADAAPAASAPSSEPLPGDASAPAPAPVP